MTTRAFSLMILVAVAAAIPAFGEKVEPLSPMPQNQAQSGAVNISGLFGGSSPPPPQLPAAPDDGYWVDNAPINEVFQYLARKAGTQYFYNNEIGTPQFNLTGHIKLDDPRRQMEDIAVAFGLTIFQQGNTVYAMNEQQLAKLPVEVMSYSLKYLRGARPQHGGSKASAGGGQDGGAGAGGGGAAAGGAGGGSEGMADFEKLKAIIRPMLTKSVGQIEFEEKTNTLLITDNTLRLKKLKELLEKLDRPKQQIAVNVRVLRVRKANGSKIGVDWSHVLGDGLPINATQSLNAMFNLPDVSTLAKASSTVKTLTDSFSNTTATSSGLNVPPSNTTDSQVSSVGSTAYSDSVSRNRSYHDGAGLIFDSLQVQAIVHALRQGDLVSQEACPTIITEDNEQGIISIVDRFPVITSNVTSTTAGQNVTDEVRYKVDEKDPDPMQEPDKSREIGVTLSVTPTLLPDGTVRMKLRPRVATVIELVPGKSGNVYPRVSESTAEAISRIPNGQSLILGGFYDYSNTDSNSKVPLLSNIPVLSRLFSYKEKKMEQVSLVFIITPTVYDAENMGFIPKLNDDIQQSSGITNADVLQLSSRMMTPAERSQDSGRRGKTVAHRPEDEEAEARPRRTWLGRLFSKD